jgi:intracellular protein transport protein USO1
LRKELTLESDKKVKELREDAKKVREESVQSSARIAGLEEELQTARDKALKVCIPSAISLLPPLLTSHHFHQATAAAKSVEEARQSTQSELDDLLMVFSDLEEKVAKYKVCQSHHL